MTCVFVLFVVTICLWCCFIFSRFYYYHFFYQDDDDEEFKGARQRWTLEEDKKLRAAVAAIGTKNWRRISEEYFDELRSEDSLSVRWFRIHDNKKYSINS